MARRTPTPPPTSTYQLAVQHTTCASCGTPLYIAHHTHRTIRRLDGVWRLTMPHMRCLNSHCASFRKLCRPEEEGAWALPHGEFGFDVIALVGQHRSLPEIHQELCARGVVIAERTVTNLLARYEELVALRLTDTDVLRQRFLPQGQIILGIDGLKPDVGHEVLWVLRDCLSGEVLLARSLLSEAEEELVALLQEVQALVPVPIIGVISDGQIGLRHAVAKALPNIPHQLCQHHYLREAAKLIYEADRHAKKDLKALVRDIRPVERLMEQVLAHQPEITPAYMRGLSEEEARIVQDYCLAVRSALTDDGQPPLCAAGLRLQERLTKIAASLQQAMLSGGSNWRLVYALERVQRSIQRGLTHIAARWPPIQTAYALVFRAVHILNNEEHVSAVEVRRRYGQVLHEMQDALTSPGTDALVQAWYTTFLKVTASYGEALFWCYDHPDLPHTNNDLEHLFGSLHYHERRASGRKQVAPTLLLRGQARVLASVSTRLRTYWATDLFPSDLARWRSLRNALDGRQETRRQQRRFRQNPQCYLLALEERCEQVTRH